MITTGKLENFSDENDLIDIFEKIFHYKINFYNNDIN